MYVFYHLIPALIGSGHIHKMSNVVNYNSVSRWTKTILLLAVAVVAIVFSAICLMRLNQSKTISLSLFTNVPSALQSKPPSPVQDGLEQNYQMPEETAPVRTRPSISYDTNEPIPPQAIYQSAPLTVNTGTCPEGTERRPPNAIIIGIRKAGTKAILSYLSLHSKIRVTEQDEIHYFDMNNNYYLGNDWYLSKMPCTRPDQITIEKTPAYFFRNYVPERVHWLSPNMKLIIVVREPVERAISDYMQVLTSVYNNDMNLTFEQLAIRNDTGEVDQAYTAIKWSMYYQYMHNWLHWFPLEQFYFIRANDLFRTPSKALEGNV